MALLARFTEALKGLPIVDGDTVIIAVSGGPDSVAMLHLFAQIAPRRDLKLVVVHVDHGIRGDEAKADADFVRDIAEAWGLGCYIERCDVPALVKSRGWSIETAARRARYSALANVAKRKQARWIAVGHHADDQAETILMHILRGSGIGGLRGMAGANPLSDDHVIDEEVDINGLTLIRPMLGISRDEIEGYCAEHGLETRIDLTNADTTIRRNRIRHEIMPLLREINPQISSALARLSEIVAADYAYLDAQVDAVWTRLATESQGGVVFSQAEWSAQPLAIRRGLLRRAALRLLPFDKPLDFEHVEAAIRMLDDPSVGQEVMMPGGVRIKVGYEEILISGEGFEADRPDWPLLAAGASLDIDAPGMTTLEDSGWVFEIARYVGPQKGPEWKALLADPWRAVLGSRLQFPVAIRTRQPGDRFYPQGAGGSQKVSDFQINTRIPAGWRDRLPLLVSDDEITWVCGWRVDERYVVSKDDGDIWLAVFKRIA